jgi:DNA-binding transcriptional LysR family regulator
MSTHRSAGLTVDDFALISRVAELRNLSAVARERDVPPSQVSRALARIERHCGLRLVHRSTHGLSLTAEGESLVQHGAQVLAAAEALDAELDERRGEASGLVKIATSPVMALLLLPALKPLLAAHPRLRVELAADDRLVDIAREGVDIAIRTGEPGSDGLVARPLGQHTRGLYAAPAYLAQFGVPQVPADLARHRLIANSASPVLNRWPFVVEGQALEWRVDGALRTDNTAVVLAMALAGLGIARLNRSAAAPHVASGALQPLLRAHAPVRPNPIVAVMRPERQRLPKVRVCVEHFAAFLGALEEGGAEG